VRRSWRVGVVAITAAILAAQGSALLRYPWWPFVPWRSNVQRVERRNLVTATAARTRSNNSVYVLPIAIPAFLYFATDWTNVDLPATHRLIQTVDLDGPAPNFRDMRNVIGPPLNATDAELTMPWGQGTLMVGRPLLVGTTGPSAIDQAASWATREASRIHRAGRCVDVLQIQRYLPEQDGLESALVAAGGRIEDRRTNGRDLAYRVCFVSTIEQLPRP
jgi:hypothetical protein